uniref:Uncharacterized protein n=1 Tax=Oryza nivara TaxID=4536 RepID=A0A0E0ID26_ORYNI
MSGREHASQGAEAAEHRPPAQPRQEGQHLPPAATQRNHSGAGGGCSARTRRNGGGGLEWGRVQHLFYVLGELESFSGDANHFLAAHGLRALARWLPAAVGTAAAAAVQASTCGAAAAAATPRPLHVVDLGVSHGVQRQRVARGAGECVDEVEAVEGVAVAEEDEVAAGAGEEGGVARDRVGGEGCRDDELGERYAMRYAGAEEPGQRRRSGGMRGRRRRSKWRQGWHAAAKTR